MLPINVPRCHQIHLNGVRCGSPALRGQTHCYYHSVLRQKRDVPTIPYLEDALSVQFSLREIMQGVALGQWDLKRAALLLYALQIASSNLNRIQRELIHAHVEAITEVPLESYIDAPEKKNVGAPFFAKRSSAERRVGKKTKAAHRSAKPAKKPAMSNSAVPQFENSAVSKPAASAGFPGMFMPGESKSRANGSA